MSKNTGIFFTTINVLAIFCIILSLVGNFLSFYYWNFILNGLIKIALVVVLLIVEFVQPTSVVKPFSFMFYFLGRGLFYIFLGFISMGIDILSVIAGFILVAIGIFYVIMHFVKRDGEPDSMSFVRYQRLSSGISHELPTAANMHSTYPIARQVPLSQPNVSVPATEPNNHTQTSIHMPNTTVETVTATQPTETVAMNEKTET
ncbi:COPI associated protein-domain-containing protein [Choanephora cucurbitarum]|nr:COPI associated protein-domain-containing protein [Choanephora cucurbitarum]